MNDAIKRLKEKAQNEKTVIGLSELLRLAKEENKELRAEVDRLKNETPPVPPKENKEPELKVVPLYETNFRSIPDALRKIADQIESGENGDVNDIVIVTQGAELNVYHTGAGNVETAHLLLACAQRRLELAVLNHYA